MSANTLPGTDERLLDWQTELTTKVAGMKDRVVQKFGEKDYEWMLGEAQRRDREAMDAYGQFSQSFAQAVGSVEDRSSSRPFLEAARQALGGVGNDRARERIALEVQDLEDAAMAWSQLTHEFGQRYGDPAVALREFRAAPNRAVGDVSAALSGLSDFWAFKDEILPLVEQSRGDRSGMSEEERFARAALNTSFGSAIRRMSLDEAVQGRLGFATGGLDPGAYLFGEWAKKNPEAASLPAEQQKAVGDYLAARRAYLDAADSMEAWAEADARTGRAKSYREALETYQDLLAQTHPKLQEARSKLPVPGVPDAPIAPQRVQEGAYGAFQEYVRGSTGLLQGLEKTPPGRWLLGRLVDDEAREPGAAALAFPMGEAPKSQLETKGAVGGPWGGIPNLIRGFLPGNRQATLGMLGRLSAEAPIFWAAQTMLGGPATALAQRAGLGGLPARAVGEAVTGGSAMVAATGDPGAGLGGAALGAAIPVVGSAVSRGARTASAIAEAGGLRPRAANPTQQAVSAMRPGQNVVTPEAPVGPWMGPRRGVPVGEPGPTMMPRATLAAKRAKAEAAQKAAEAERSRRGAIVPIRPGVPAIPGRAAELGTEIAKRGVTAPQQAPLLPGRRGVDLPPRPTSMLERARGETGAGGRLVIGEPMVSRPETPLPKATKAAKVHEMRPAAPPKELPKAKTPKPPKKGAFVPAKERAGVAKPKVAEAKAEAIPEGFTKSPAGFLRSASGKYQIHEVESGGKWAVSDMAAIRSGSKTKPTLVSSRDAAVAVVRDLEAPKAAAPKEVAAKEAKPFRAEAKAQVVGDYPESWDLDPRTEAIVRVADKMDIDEETAASLLGASGRAKKNLPRDIREAVDRSVGFLPKRVEAGREVSFNERVESSMVRAEFRDQITGRKYRSIGSAGSSELLAVAPVEGQGTPVDRAIAAIGEMKPLRAEQQKLYSAERAKRFRRIEQIGASQRGEAGLLSQKAAAKGRLPEAQYESIRNRLTQEDLDALLDQVQDSEALSTAEKFRARIVLNDKLFGGAGGKLPQPNELDLLGRVFGPKFVETVQRKSGDTPGLLSKIVGASRTILATDVASAVGRQGVLMAWRHPKLWAKSARQSLRYFRSEKAYSELAPEITQHREYAKLKKAGLNLPALSRGGTRTELDEAWMMAHVVEGLAHKKTKHLLLKPAVAGLRLAGRFTRAADRGYNGFLTKARWMWANSLVTHAKKSGRSLSDEEYRDIAHFVNTFTRRGGLGKWETAASPLASALFAPRYYASAIRILNPATYVPQKIGKLKLPPAVSSPYGEFVRKEAARTMLHFLAGTSAVAGLAAINGAKVSLDWRNPDFGKIKVGEKVRLDIASGLPQFVRLLGQLFTGETVSSTTGKVTKLGEGFKPKTRLDVVGQFAESKAAPYPGMVVSLLRGRDFDGNPIRADAATALRMLARLYSPIFVQELVDVFRADPALAPLSFLSQGGIGVQTYPTETTRAMDRASRLAVERAADGKDPTGPMESYAETMSEFYKAIREGKPQDEVDRIRDRADTLARVIVGMEGW